MTLSMTHESVGKQRRVSTPLSLVRKPNTPTSHSGVHHLGSIIGNRAVGQLLQAKRRIGAASDRFEQEADRIADRVLATPAHSVLDQAPPRIQRHSGSSVAVAKVPASVERVLGTAGRPLALAVQQDMGRRFAYDFSPVRIHCDAAAAQSAQELNAQAYAVGRQIVFGAGQYAPGTLEGRRLLAHELTHVVQQSGSPRSYPGGGGEKQNRSPMRARPRSLLGDTSGGFVQRQVRLNGGRTRVNEADYLPGGRKQSRGRRHSIASLIGDTVKRVFTSVGELERYANGSVDYIGDVVTSAAGTFWYRLARRRLTVLGESHHNPDGNVEDVILGLHTSRFMYEPFNEFAGVAPFRQSRIGTGTQTRLAQIHSTGIRVGGLVNRRRFNPDLENIVIKALTGSVIARNEYIAADPAAMSVAQQRLWRSRATSNDYSYGERTALYLSMAMHIAKDIAQFRFRAPRASDRAYLTSGRALAAFYTANQAELDLFMQIKDADELIGIYELTESDSFANLPVIRDFTLVFHEFASRYIEQLGRQMGSRALRNEGSALAGNVGAIIDDLSPAREEIMWRKIMQARRRGYLIVGMGEAHRQNLQPQLTRASIANEEVKASLLAQQAAINTTWVP